MRCCSTIGTTGRTARVEDALVTEVEIEVAIAVTETVTAAVDAAAVALEAAAPAKVAVAAEVEVAEDAVEAKTEDILQQKVPSPCIFFTLFIS